LLGSVVVAELTGAGIPVVSVDRAPRRSRDRREAGVTEVVADVRQTDWWSSIAGCDVVVNLIGTGDHRGSQEQPEQDLIDNCATALAALEAVRAIGATRVWYASTRQVYGVAGSLPVDESHPPSPIDVNGVHRFAAESYHAVYARTCELAFGILRFTNLYGPSMRPDAPMFLARWLAQARRGEPFEVWGGTQVRDLLHVDDAARALIAALPHCSPAGTVLNCGGAEATTLLDLAARLGKLGLKHRVIPYPPDRAALEIGDFTSDSSRLTRMTGWRPTVRLDDGLREAVQAAGLLRAPSTSGGRVRG
jgi:nucleoside-diphosphate-sugar epimerase